MQRTAPPRRVRIAVDVGGTFTDFEILDEATGETLAAKTQTTPEDPSEGLLTGLRVAAERFGFSLGDISALLHGTTIATNAVLQRRLPKGALITTAGFEDVLEIGRHFRRDVYASKAEPRAMLIPRAWRLGIKERTLATGAIETPLDETEIVRVAERLETGGVQCVAVCLLSAYANADHETRIGALLAKHAPGLDVSLSHEVSPEIREFERTSTTVLNALLVPVVRGYLERLRARLKEAGFTAPVYLVQSNGGVMSPENGRLAAGTASALRSERGCPGSRDHRAAAGDAEHGCGGYGRHKLRCLHRQRGTDTARHARHGRWSAGPAADD